MDSILYHDNLICYNRLINFPCQGTDFLLQQPQSGFYSTLFTGVEKTIVLTKRANEIRLFLQKRHNFRTALITHNNMILLHVTGTVALNQVTANAKAISTSFHKYNLWKRKLLTHIIV